MGEDVISEIKRDYVFSLARDGKRFDGRRFDEYRPVSIQTGMIKQAEGSARVRIGDTDVFAGIKMQVGTPYPDSPNSGTLTTSAELIPMASPDFEPGPPRPGAIELARVVDRGIRESGMINVENLCITPGEKVWVCYVDIHIVDYDGNLFDTCSLAAAAALLTAHVPNSKLPEPTEDKPMPIDHFPVMTTALKLGPGKVAFDPGLMEDKVGGPRLSVSFDENGDIRAMQKGNRGGFTKQEILDVIQTGRTKADELRKQLFAATGRS